MDAYRALRGAGISTRAASGLTGIARSSADRERTRPTRLRPARSAPANSLSDGERARVLAVLDSPQFVGAAPAQVYAALLDQGVYLGSISSMYRILRSQQQVRERRRLARHPARTRSELVAAGPSLDGVAVRVAQRLLALTAAIWHNRATGQPVTRSLIAHDH